ncbi:HAMP domain-containing methyl-accepting chemotaxis protein [Breoghania sp. L-A4]|uniref:methyl-accepting chemotaxis protein n=1 Tax=Breoghania sp. L-A4 TaxID=2304600 RepID=UPI000E35A86D|nr:HAMP domain-containing methyl-accepting chemotaxis protein [Breoghania sp. L-A4]AXS39850.1 HAMP domain-containing protein [Breoghania sp. L-A4]
MKMPKALKNDAKGNGSSPRRTSIRFKITGYAFLCLFAGFLVASGLAFWSSNKHAAHDIEIAQRQVISLAAGQISGGVRFKKADAIDALFASLRDDVNFEGAYFIALDNDGAVISQLAVIEAQAEHAMKFAKAALVEKTIIFSGATDLQVAAAPVFFGKSEEPIGSVAFVRDYTEFFSSLRQESIIIFVVTMVLGGVFLVAFNILVGRSVTSPIRGLTDAMKRLADGDTGLELDSGKRNDELSDMMGAVAVFRDNAIERSRLASESEIEQAARQKRQQTVDSLIGTFRTEIRELLDAVGANADNMQETARTLTGIANETSGQAAGAKSASEEASSNVQTVAAAAEELAASIEEISRQVTTTTDIVGQATANAAATDSKIGGLATAASKIGDVVSLIQAIAEQTNLLALNATIEAARAGEAGKGFAVVASEVKELATQTSKATEEIGSQVAAIQASTEEAVEAIRLITETMDKVNEYTSSISAAVTEQGAATTEISRNVQEAAAGTQSVVANMNHVTGAVSETMESANQVLVASGEVNEQSGKLRLTVDSFLERVAAA